MGKQWDTGDTVHAVEFWAECLRVLKPGGHLLSCSGTRTYHRMACAIEDAGFEIRDMIGYLYGSGFPKSHNISKAIGVCACEALPERDMRSLREANVPEAQHVDNKRREVLLASLPKHSASIAGRQESASHVRGEKPGMEGRRNASEASRQLRSDEIHSLPAGSDADGAMRRICDGASRDDGAAMPHDLDPHRMRASSGSQPDEQRSDEPGIMAGQSKPQTRGAWQDCGRCGKPLVPDGLGTALKPAQEPIVLARKPLSEKTVAANVLLWGVGALNINGCRVRFADEADEAESKDKNRHSDFGSGPRENAIYGSDSRARGLNGNYDASGRWPANIIHDGSDEVVGAFPDNLSSGTGAIKKATGAGTQANAYGKESRPVGTPNVEYGDTGSAARFFYTAKADADDRLGASIRPSSP
jgi:hypothetical protein